MARVRTFYWRPPRCASPGHLPRGRAEAGTTPTPSREVADPDTQPARHSTRHGPRSAPTRRDAWRKQGGSMQTVTLDDTQAEKMTDILARCPLFRALKPEHLPQVLKVGEVVIFDP